MDEQKILQNFGLNFKFHRMKLKLSQDDIVALTNFSKSYISNIENAKHSLSLVNALALSKIVNKSLDEMIQEV